MLGGALKVILDYIERMEKMEAQKPHTVSEVICVKCLKRWICVRPSNTLLKDLECENCGRIQSVIETGQVLDTESD